MNPPDSDQRLTSMLRDWQVSPARDPAFRTAVWSRIEATRRPPGWTGYLRRHPVWIGGALVLALVAGAWTGRGQAKARAAADRTAMATSYVQALDARTMRMP